MAGDTFKRKSSQLSPPISEVQKRYAWDTQQLIEQNKYYLPPSVEANISGNNQATALSDQQINTADKNNPRVKIPPIFLHGNVNYQEVITDIKTIVKNDFSTSYTSRHLRVGLTAIDDYRDLTKYYNENSVKYHTYQNPNDKPLCVVIKNLPLSLTEEEVKAELIRTNLPVTKVTRLLNREKKPYPICAIELTRNEKANDIFKLERILHSIVIIENRRKPRDLPQCYRCQRFGHTKNYCALDPRCVKCEGNHLTTLCTKQSDLPPKCVNCGQDHPANFRGCLYYQEQTIKQTSRRPALTSTPNTRTSNPVTTQRSYADATSGRLTADITSGRFTQTNTTNQASASDSSSPLDNILQTLLDLIKPYLTQIKSFIMSHIIPTLING